jgi:hypothetical protein
MAESNPDLERARALSRRVVDLGEAGDLATLALLAGDPETGRLLGTLDAPTREHAEAFLHDAERWERRRHEVNERRLREARKALDGLDLELARGLAHKLDGRFMTPDQEEMRDELLIDIESRSMELESLVGEGDRLIDRDKPRADRERRRRRHKRSDD